MKLEPSHTFALLNQLAVKFTPTGDDKLKVCCPFHADVTPSAELHLSSNRFSCYAAQCQVHGDLVKYFAKVMGDVTGTEVGYTKAQAYIAKQYNLKLDGYAPLAADKIEEAHRDIWQPNPIVAAIRAKGITDELIQKFRLGYADGRIWIPVKDVSGTAYVNVRKYLPNAPGSEKMRNVTGRSAPLIYPADQLRYDTLLFCGGEMKAILASTQLNPHNIGAVCITAGEGVLPPDLVRHFHDKVVYICLDIDKGGRQAAVNVAKRLYTKANAVYIITLPLDPAKYPKGDINNYVHDEQGNLLEAIKLAVEYIPQSGIAASIDETSAYTRRSIHEALSAGNIGTRSEIECSVVGVAEQRYAIPKEVKVTCQGDKDYCIACNVYARRANPVFIVPAESQWNLALCNSTDNMVGSILRNKVIGIPDKCKENSMAVLSRYGAEIVAISPAVHLSATSDNDKRSIQKALVLGDGVEPNTNYIISGRVQPDPKTQEAVMLVSEFQRAANALDSAELADTDSLSIFQCDNTVEALDSKLREIWFDLSCNVTCIYKRPELHAIVDIVYHSPLLFQFDSTVPQKGYIEALIIGDTGQGKSEVSSKLKQHYSLGHSVDMANATVAGLLGGLQQLSGMWMITWGAFPNNDGQLLILEEVKRAPVETIAALTETRSSGIAKQDKIRAGSRLARPRVLALSNPRSDRPIRAHSSGVESVLELIGNPEDVRRFDICTCVSSEDLPDDVVHGVRPTAPHVYTSELCNRLILWAWKLKPDNVCYTEAAKQATLVAASAMATKYSDRIPLVDNGTIRLKIARVSAAIAARTFSTSDGVTLDVLPHHVKWAVDFMHRLYDSPAMAYDRYSAAIKRQETVNANNMARVFDELQALPYAAEAIQHMREATFIKVSEIAMIAGTTNEQVNGMLGAIMRAGGLVHRSNSMILTSGFRQYLATLDTTKMQKAPNAF